MARQSLARGHWRVALRRLLMAQARGDTLAGDLQEALAQLRTHLSATEHTRMQDAARRWVLMTRGVPPSKGA